MSVAIGDVAPAFTLLATGGKHVSLGDYLGHPVVLVFYPADDTPVCTRQLNTYNDDLSQFAAMNAQVLAISSQSVESHEKFARRFRPHGLREGAMAACYAMAETTFAATQTEPGVDARVIHVDRDRFLFEPFDGNLAERHQFSPEDLARFRAMIESLEAKAGKRGGR